MNDEETLLSNPAQFINLGTVGSLDPEIDLSTNLVDAIDDTDLFKYFLSDDLSSLSDQNGEYLLNSSPNSSLSLESNSSDSPQPSPPQLSPDPTLDIAVVPGQLNPTQTNQTIRIKQEVRPSVPVQAVNLVDAKGKGSRKRDRSLKDVESPQALSRDELVKLSSKGVDSFAQNLAAGRAPPEEEKAMKRQKRLIKNRESAQLSRLRKKIYIEELERKVTCLTSETDALTKQVTQLSGDKKKLQEEVMYLQSIIKQSPELSELASRRSVPIKNVKAAGICLLIVMFSIGLLFNANQNDPNLPFGSRNREEIPEVMPKAGKTVYSGRVLKSIPEEDITNIEVLPITSEIRGSTKTSFVKSVAEEAIPVASLSFTKDAKDKKHARDEDEKVDKQADKKRKVKIAEEDEDINDSLVPMEQVRDIKVTNEIVPRRDPNASYIYCSEAHHLVPATATSGPEVVALLIPASIFNGSTIFGNHPGMESALLEVSCSVLNLHMWPLQNITTQP